MQIATARTRTLALPQAGCNLCPEAMVMIADRPAAQSQYRIGSARPPAGSLPTSDSRFPIPDSRLQSR
jgi:hypothetical protein